MDNKHTNRLINEKSTIGGEFAMAHTWPCKCKITIVRREYYQDLANEYLANPNIGKCNKFFDGQEFVVDKESFVKMMNGEFCSEAWDCISKYVYTALQGGSIMHGWTNDEKVMITCCNDGIRPVIFKLERIDG